MGRKPEAGAFEGEEQGAWQSLGDGLGETLTAAVEWQGECEGEDSFWPMARSFPRNATHATTQRASGTCSQSPDKYPLWQVALSRDRTINPRSSDPSS